MSEQHTPEPWAADHCLIYADSGIQPHVADTIGFTDRPEINARRIVACVNACAGIADPESELARLRRINEKLVEEMQRFLPVIEYIEKHPNANVWCAATRGTGIATANGYRQSLAAAKEE